MAEEIDSGQRGQLVETDGRPHTARNDMQHEIQHNSPDVDLSSGTQVESHDDYEYGSDQSVSWPCLWVWELIAAAFSIVCLGLMLALVSIMDDRPLSRWRLPISPNALLAVFSTLSKSAVLMVLAECVGQLKWVYFQQRAHPVRDLSLFDKASRGPWGAAQLVFCIGPRAVAASAGCILILLTLAMEPFAQQVLSYSQQLVTDESTTAPLTVMRSFNDSLTKFDPTGIIYEDVDAIPAQYTCNSEVCTWSDFTSLAICSQCTDISDAITMDCRWHPPNANFNSAHIACNYAFPRFPSGNWKSKVLTAWTWIDQNNYNTILNVTIADPVGDLSTLNAIVGLDILEIPRASYPGNRSESIYHPIAQRCSFSWCGSSQSSLVVQNNTATNHGIKFSEIKFNTCFWTNDFQTKKCLGFIPDKEGQLPKNLSDSDARSLYNDFQNLPKDSTAFLVDRDLTFDLQYHIKEMFAFGDSSIEVGGYGVWPTSDKSFTHGLIEKLHDENDGNYNRTLEKWAAIMSSRLLERGASDADRSILQGECQHSETFVHVTWAWLILPAGVVVLSVLLLLASILFSAEKSQVVWKTSVLATLFHGLQGWPSKRCSSLLTSRDMEHSAGNMRAMLGRNEEGEFLLQRQDE